MNNYEILMRAQDISNLFWRNLMLRWQAELRLCLPTLDAYALGAEHHRSGASHNTGSIPAATAAALMILAAEIKPARTFELGTFIGNSTHALAMNSEHVWTCDGHNDIDLGLPNVTQYRKTMSTQALLEYQKAQRGPIELMFVDGRILEADAALLRDVTNGDTVFALDDCYQTEKGVVNANALGAMLPDRPLFYMPPPQGEPFKDCGVLGGTTLGLAVSAHRLVLSKA